WSHAPRNGAPPTPSSLAVAAATKNVSSPPLGRPILALPSSSPATPSWRRAAPVAVIISPRADNSISPPRRQTRQDILAAGIPFLASEPSSPTPSRLARRFLIVCA
ncbi:Os03g0373500, partial [Oryza sativa Japonica Group]